ncbi:MAG: GlmU family protein [Cyclobacteriaceae bacterium]|nr:GlmU family protein [Cyclobacteriaceae bacterium]
MNVVLFDEPAARTNLLPFTFTRAVSDIRIGILTIAEKWGHELKRTVSRKTAEYLQIKYPLTSDPDTLYIDGAVCPDKKLVETILNLKPGEGLKQNNLTLAYRITGESNINYAEYPEPILRIDQPWKIFQHNAAELRKDFARITTNRKSAPISDPHTKVYHPENIFLEEGVHIRAAILNAEDGPIYLGKNAVVQEGAIIKGPFSLGEGAHVNMGGKMRSDTTVGPYCKVGGEISNSVFFGFSNKAHDGFLGNSVIGEWCNLGADTNTSNLKNNYEYVKLWSYAKGGFVNTGLQFCGLMMGDHSKCGINTMFNTGTVVGVSANIFGDGFPRNFIPSFSWGGANGFTTYQINKALETAQRVMARRNRSLEETDIQILSHVFEITATYRVWEKK